MTMMYEGYIAVAYGCGKSFYSYMERLDKVLKIKYFCDRNSMLIGKNLYGDSRCCLAPESLEKLENPFVVITADDVHAAADIQNRLDRMNIPYAHARKILESHSQKADAGIIRWPENIQKNKIHRFIDLNLVGTTSCNLHCEYCYVWRKMGFHGENVLSDHSVEELCAGLSAERTGGICFINLCARGETLLADGIVEFTKGLLLEGHYVSIVTNAAITKRIDEILKLPKGLLERLFFKISFHYKELKARSLLDVFWENVKKIKESKCSFTLEITPGDGSEQLIEEMKVLCRDKMEGALPHVSFTRDSKKIGYDLLSGRPIETYRKIWGQFDSKMFDLKSSWYGKNMKPYTCYAGTWSYLVNVMTGDIKACYQRKPIGNIFDKENSGFPVEAVGKDCCISYCFNNHAFLAWGCVPEVDCASYLDMRDRTANDGCHWVKEPVSHFMAQKLYENNFAYINRWPDYEKLYKKERKKAILLFNSPDYANLGDHAIALAERQFFRDYFGEYDYIEISCSQYIKENLRIKNAVRKDDVLVITGGGNTGDAYLRLQDITSHIIQSYQDNRIIAAPQSIYFEGGKFSDAEKERIKKVYERHGRLLLAAREQKTYMFYESVFHKRIEKAAVPDMAFFLKCEQHKSRKRQGALICLREDKESMGKIEKYEAENTLKQLSYTVSECSMTPSAKIMLADRERKVFEALDTIGKAEIVVTDRLHCMIFCILTDTPCVVFDNTTGKVSEIAKSLQGDVNIVLCPSSEVLGDAVKKAAASKFDHEGAFKRMGLEFEAFAGRIRSFLDKQIM